MAVIPVA